MYKHEALLLAAFIVGATVLPACAQGYTPTAEQRRAAQVRAHMPNIGRPYSMRVTVGSHTNAGFEQSLTEKDPSLRHWTWVPVQSFDQAYIKVGQAAKMPSSPNATAAQRSTHVYVKPNHVPLPQRTYDWSYLNAKSGSGSHSQSDVSGKIRVAHQPAVEAKSYGGSYSDVSGRVRLANSETSESRDVYGKLLTRSHTH